METFLILIFAFLLMGILCYILYISGYMVINAKIAVLFIGSIGRYTNRCNATISSCNGYIKKGLKFKENRQYQFNFNSSITKGHITIELQNKNKETILLLDSNHKSGNLNIEKNGRYYLVLRFHNADGNYDLTWHEQYTK